MSKQTQAISNHLGALTNDARAFLTDNAEVALEKVEEARKRLAAAMDSGKESYDRVRGKAVEGVKVADQTVRDNPYQVLAIGVGVGAMLGYLLARHRTCSRS